MFWDIRQGSNCSLLNYHSTTVAMIVLASLDEFYVTVTINDYLYDKRA